MFIEIHGAGREVTGSCYLVKAGDRRVLVDCGLIQGGAEDDARNRIPFGFGAARLDAVVLTHAHIDHSGRLPLLARAGFRGPIYTHAATADLCRVMLKDSAYLQEKAAEWENRKRERKGLDLLEPLYTRADASTVLRRMRTLPYDLEKTIVPGVTIRLRDAGHILGSACVEMFLEEGPLRRKVVFSGDLGHRDAPILRDPTRIAEADLVFMESTYGDHRHRPWDETWKELGEIISESHSEKGNILIPAFAVGRSQELLYAFRENFKAWGLNRWHIFLDSPMAIEATEIYRRLVDVHDGPARELRRSAGGIFNLPNLTLSRTSKQSMRINRVRSGAIIIAGSGMCTGGRIRHHLKQNVWRPGCQVMFVGYQAPGTLGRQMVDGADEIKLWGESIRVSARIHTIGGLSAHADADGLVHWYEGFSGHPPLVLTHGEHGPMDALAERLRAAHGTRIMRPAIGEGIDLTSRPPKAIRQQRST